MKKLILITSILALFINCEQKSTTVVVDKNDTVFLKEETVPNKNKIQRYQCYLVGQNKDSVFLQLEFEGKSFAGKLVHHNYQKDSSFGTYSGELRGDTLVGTYNFMSEGMVSKIEKAFLQKDNQLLEGIGPFKDGASQYELVFVDYDSIQFDQMRSLQKVDCSNHFLPKEYDDFWNQLQ